ncbi:TRAP transporter large permease [Tepidanaerobacter acetatoxydans]|uniref:TRAP transporter large permease n=1 Tax=Tepidanaerobacter acetatoxydans TaxID=499229 RepID=UPI001BD52EB4|nr:TRAP transporter large permease [Tepidanaerobacter acetatoxydans]
MIAVVLTFAILLTMGMPVAFVMGISGFVFFIGQETLNFTIPVQLTLTQTQNFAMLAIPMFIFAGNLMNQTGITEHLLKLASVLTGHMRAGIAQTTVVLSALMGGVSSSAIGDANMQARIFQPAMEAKKYPRGFGAASIAFSSIITPVIPPGTGLILYGTIGEVSIGRLFAAGIIPGILLTITLMIAVGFTAKKLNLPPEREKRASFAEMGKTAIDCIWALAFPIILFLGMRTGFFTPSEAGAFTVVYAVAIGILAYKELTWRKFKEALEITVVDVGMIMLLICLSGALSYALTWEMVPQRIMEFLLGITQSPMLIMVLIIIFLLIAGMFVDSTVLILLLTPMLVPVATQIGFDPVHFGIVAVLTLTCGLLTPPVGVCMYVVTSIYNCTIDQYIREAKYMWISIFAAIVLILLIPQLTLWLPEIIFSK